VSANQHATVVGGTIDLTWNA